LERNGNRSSRTGKNKSMKEFEILEHKADLKIRAFGKTREELFLNMLFGMADSQKPEIRSKERIKRKIKIKSLDLLTLLVDFLNEVLYLSQVNKEVYLDFKFKRLNDNELKGEITGQKINKFGEDIKAATFHNLEIKQEDGTWQATVLFDI
jgi:SHS2 domain-containing protein